VPLVLNMSRGTGSHHYSSLRSGDYDEENAYSSRGGGQLMFVDQRITDQNNSLEQLGFSVTRLGEMSLTISKEIDTQNKLLSSLETDIEKNKEATESITKKTKEFVQKAGGSKVVCIIISLILLFLVMLFLVMYT
jgi:t-SNARE complex subunit (syntaxin)